MATGRVEPIVGGVFFVGRIFFGRVSFVGRIFFGRVFFGGILVITGGGIFPTLLTTTNDGVEAAAAAGERLLL